MSGWDDEPPAAGAPAPLQSPADAWDAEAPEAGAAGGAVPASALEGVASGVITLGESPDAEHLLQDLLARPPGEPPRLNASAVTHLSVPALQVLLSAMRETAAGGGRLVIQDPSFALNLAFEAFGFAGSNEPFTVEYT